MVITYHPQANRNIITVKVGGIKTGEIRMFAAGFRFHPNGNSKPGDTFPTLADCKDSLEA